ncbi:DUF2059 domain-containing protein [Xanthomonas translucens]|uniref:DUF2059 domain-containing protein n=1 Tax=Xanthomonas campestris pv. translucens TaxID=343 RepID=UPI0002A7B3AC|nr:DUF2059 domain-containing protein [Xanthomonas translucens]AVY65027.1 hypothetical protein NZ30_01130 [Xanthomonas translucens pv. undulosa]ELQ11851.1 hypothetical protein A989_07228 [Xanthomonas translucens DAR61454]MBC3973725.1 DUF2059 domain-containing protein [Xanthomonas translucens pv. undulosa]MCT8270505.1 DUF2059 domain-containing protein [Xanthomonas translucens pv. undulosa]MCT8282767.1 DUF2059 domain-containing protein [Xanthomonas translucens pv. undulosa]
MNPTPLLSRRWPQRLLLAALLALAASPALSEPPSDGDVNRLLSASRAQNMLDSMLPQIEAMQRQQFAQLTAQRPLDAAQQQKVQQIQERTQATVRKALSWQEMRPLYVSLYKQSFSRQDVLAMAEFYESPAGQSMLDKTPQLMQNLMGAIQQKITPLFADLQKDLEQTVNTPPPAPAEKP